MKQLIIIIIFLSASIGFGNEKKKSVQDKVAEMVVYLRKFSQIKEVFPEKVLGVSEKTRSDIAIIVKGFGKEKIPHLVNFDSVIRAISISGEVETIEFYSFDPMEFNYNGKDFKYSTKEEFLDAVARIVPQKSVYNLFIEQAYAKTGGYILAAAAGYSVGSSRSSSSPSSNSKGVEVSTTVNNHVTVNTPSEITFQNRTEREQAHYQDMVESISSDVSSIFPQLTCNKKDEKLLPFSSISYHKESNVTVVKYKPNDSNSSLEIRQNHIDGTSLLAFCEADKSECIKTNYREIRGPMGQKIESPARQKTIDDEKAKTNSLLADLKSAYDNYSMIKKTLEDSAEARVVFLQSKEIKYPKTATLNDLEKELLSDAAVERAYQFYLQSKNAHSPFLRQDVIEKAKTLINRAMAVSKEKFKMGYYMKLYDLGYTKQKVNEQFDEDLFEPKISLLDSFVENEMEKMRPFAAGEKVRPQLTLTGQHEIEFQKSLLASKGESPKLESQSVAVSNVVKKIRDYLKLKPGQASRGCDAELFEDIRRTRKGRVKKFTYKVVYDDSIEHEYFKMKCSLEARNDYLFEEASPARFSRLSTEILQAADCCLDNTCKEKVLKKIRDKKIARETQYKGIK